LSFCPAVRADAVYLGGAWYDTDKTNDSGSGRGGNYYEDLDGDGEYTLQEPWKEHLAEDLDGDRREDIQEDWGTWLWHGVDEVYYDDQNGSNTKDPGEPTTDTLEADEDEDRREDSAENFPGAWLGHRDNSCWAATANNLIRAVGGPDNYMTWMYETGICAKNWTHSGSTRAAVLEGGHFTTSLDAAPVPGNGWMENPVPTVRQWLSDGLPVGIGVDWAGGGAHAFTLYGIDGTDNAGTLTIADSDSDRSDTGFHTVAYQYNVDSQWLLDWSSTGDFTAMMDAATTYFTAYWTGDGGNTWWDDEDNWAGAVGGNVPSAGTVVKIEFGGAGRVDVRDADATALKCIVSGEGTTLDVNPTGMLSLSILHAVNGGEVLIDDGLVTASRDVISEGNVTVQNGGYLTCEGDGYIGSGQDGLLAVTDLGRVDVVNYFYIGHRGGSGTLDIHLGNVNVGQAEYVGYEGTGEVDHQAGGNHDVHGSLYVGYHPGTTGTLNLAAGDLRVASVSGSEYVGYEGTGQVNQTGGNHIINGSLYLGRYSSGVGEYVMADGSVEAENVRVGYDGGGLFDLSGGSVVVDNRFSVGGNGSQPGGTGISWLQGDGTLDTGELDVGYSGYGLFIQKGTSTCTVRSQLRVGALRSLTVFSRFANWW